MYKTNVISSLSKNFALRIILLYRYLTEERHEYIMSKQLCRSGTSIGARTSLRARMHKVQLILSVN